MVAPIRRSAAGAKSYRPTDMPPIITKTSADFSNSSAAAAICASSSPVRRTPPTANPAARSWAHTMAPLESRIWCGSTGLPISRSSSPFVKMATVGLRMTETCAQPAVAHNATCSGEITVPAATSRSPARASVPRRNT
jgi:hypothetical protein